MGHGDNLMASGMARGAQTRGKRIAFGDGNRIRWDQHSAEIFAGNPNVAPPGSEGAADLEWIAFYKGRRIYNSQEAGRWRWNMAFHAEPGELYFSQPELDAAAGGHSGGAVIVEPNVEWWKTVAINKAWGLDRYQALVDALLRAGVVVGQFAYGRYRLSGARQIATRNFRDAAALLQRARLYIGPEGGLHHAAAAVGTPAVVLFGGFIPPSVTGYASHTNLTGGAEACGSLTACKHCRAAMDAIGVDEVLAAAMAHLERPRR